MFRRLAGLALGLLVIAASPRHATALTIDFETFAEFDSITTEIPGLTFSNAMVLTAGSSLNELDFPPASGVNAVFDDGGPMRIDFLLPIEGFSGYFNYAVPIVLSAFSSSDVLLGTAVSVFQSNLGDVGDPGSSTNELLAVIVPGIAYVTIAGDPWGGSFTGDDFTIASATPVPEPATLSLLAVGVGALAARRRRSRRVGSSHT